LKITLYSYTLQPTELSGGAKFCVETFYVIINKMNNELEKWQQFYKTFYDIFKVQLKITSKWFRLYFLSEFIHLQSHLLNSYIDKGNFNFNHTMQVFEKKCLHIEIFPNIDTALRIVVSVPVSKCTTGRLFLCLMIHTKRWKVEQFFSIGQ